MKGSLPEACPVLIVGTGPTGLLAANLLGTYGVETLVVEQNEATSQLPKAILIDDDALRALQAVGLVDEVLERVISGYDARYYSAEGDCFAEVASVVTRNGYPSRNSFLQPDLERVMLAGLDRFESVRVEFRTRVVALEGDCVRLELADGTIRELRFRYLLACDGAKSTVREELGIRMPGMTDPRDWVVIDTVNDPDQDRFSKFFCDPARPMVSIPAPGGGRRYEYMVLPGEDPRRMSERGVIREMLSRFRVPPDEDIVRSTVYTFHARVAERLVEGPIALLGDAAHLSPPFAGQGMNAGLRDAFNVCWKVKLGLEGEEGILETYESERRGPIVEMIEYAVELGENVMPSGEAPAVRPRPEARYVDGWLRSAPTEMTGRVFPQFRVRVEGGREAMLDDLMGAGFAVVAVGGERPSETAAVSSLGGGFGLRGGSTFLVRPDRFVAAEWTEDQEAGEPATLWVEL